MAGVTIRKRSEGFSDFLRLIAAEAGRYSVELMPVGPDPHAPQGVLVLDRELSAHTRAELLQSINQPDGWKPAPLLRLNKEADPEGFCGMVQAALNRVKTSRLPCALLLIRVVGESPGTLLETTAAVLELPDDHQLAPYDEATFGLLLPGLNRQSALQKARDIQHCLSAGASCQVRIGLAVCLARAMPRSAEEFIATVNRELEKAGREAGIFYCFAEEQEDSCQVTVEERAQLFRSGGQPK